MVFLACSIAGDYGGLVVVVGRSNVGEKPVDAGSQGDVWGGGDIKKHHDHHHHHHHNNNYNSNNMQPPAWPTVMSEVSAVQALATYTWRQWAGFYTEGALFDPMELSYWPTTCVFDLGCRVVAGYPTVTVAGNCPIRGGCFS